MGATFSLPFREGSERPASVSEEVLVDVLTALSLLFLSETPFLTGAGAMGGGGVGFSVDGPGAGGAEEGGDADDFDFLEGAASASNSSSSDSGSSAGVGFLRLPWLRTSFGILGGGGGASLTFSTLLSFSRSFSLPLDPRLRSSVSLSIASTSSRRSAEPSSSTYGTTLEESAIGAGTYGPGGGTSDNLGSFGFLPLGLGVGFDVSAPGVPFGADPPSRSLMEGRIAVGVGVAGVRGVAGGASLIAGVAGIGLGGGGTGAGRA